jgi:Ca-activated chloride channel family protein
MQKVNIDENLLKSIALETGGLYYRAKDNKSLEDIYASINQLEKSPLLISQLHASQEKYHPWVWAALFFLCLERILAYTLFRRFPF